MITISEITIEEFENNIYDKYITLFPEDEQRDWKKVRKTYELGIEKIYKASLDGKDIGFFMLEKIDGYPYYGDYFAIYKEYQNQGYGALAIKKLLDEVVKDVGLVGEIEKVDDNNFNTVRRAKFYERLGFSVLDTKYSLYDVLYNPCVYPKNFDISNINDILFKYYELNVGSDNLKKHCRIVK